jgi:hypothetical protein
MDSKAIDPFYGRSVSEGEERKKNANISGHHVLSAMPEGSARTLLGPNFTTQLCLYGFQQVSTVLKVRVFLLARPSLAMLPVSNGRHTLVWSWVTVLAGISRKLFYTIGDKQRLSGAMPQLK